MAGRCRRLRGKQILIFGGLRLSLLCILFVAYEEFTTINRYVLSIRHYHQMCGINCGKRSWIVYYSWSGMPNSVRTY